MDLVDLVIAVAALVAAGSGLERGFWLTLTTYGGALVGLLGGAALAPVIAAFATAPSSPFRPYVGILVLVTAGTIASSIGYALGEPIRLRILQTPGRGRLDTVAGAALSAVATLAAAWFLGLTFSQGPLPSVADQIQRSAILRRLDDLAPRPPVFLAHLEQVLSAGFPQVFASLAPPSTSPVAIDPGASDTPGVRQAADETVKVVSQGCGGLLEGSGFPVAENQVITNAHVVAGGAETTIQVPHRRPQPAKVILFDRQRDVAILLVPGLDLKPLPQVVGQRGTQGAVIGYPGGQREQVVPLAIRAQITAQGRDIYGESLVNREIFILQAHVIPGNSGGPAVDVSGQVLGVVFAASTTDDTEAYALTNAEVQPDIFAARGRQAEVSTSDCAG